MKLNARILIGALVTAVACGGDDNGPTDPNGTDGSVTASVTGQSNYVANGVVAGYVSNVLIISSAQVTTSSDRALSLQVNNVNGPGTYALTLAGNAGQWTETSGSTTLSWLTAITQGSGSVTITSVSGNHVVGDFSFTAPANTVGGATGTRVITNGHFDVTASNPQ